MDWNSLVGYIQGRRTDLMREAHEERLARASQPTQQHSRWRQVIHLITDLIFWREHHHEDKTHHHHELSHSHQRRKHVHHG